MNIEEISKNSIVALRNTTNENWVLLTKWTDEIREKYLFAHSLPMNSQKNNVEPEFPRAVYIYVDSEKQTRDNLRKIYRENNKKKTRTKISEHKLFCAL